MNETTLKPAEGNPETQKGEPVKILENYYSDKLGQLSLMLLSLIALTVGFLILLFLIFRLQSPSPVFFPATERGEIIPEVGLDQPNMSSNALLNWVVESMMEVNTFNFINYVSVMEKSRQYFTTEGYESYASALQSTRVLPDVIARKYVLRAQATSAPQVTKEGVLANRYLWKIKVQMRFAYKNVNAAIYDDAEIILLVMRVPNNQSAFGVKILKYDLTVKNAT